MNEEPCPVTHTMLGALNRLYFLFNYTNLDFQDIILFYISMTMYKIKLQYWEIGYFENWNKYNVVKVLNLTPSTQRHTIYTVMLVISDPIIKLNYYTLYSKY